MVFLNLSRDSRLPHGFLLSHAHYVHHRVSLSYGHPYMIDVNDCDARLPSSGSPHDLYVDELARLSIILGRVLKTVYRYGLSYPASERRLSDGFSPVGLMNTTDEALAALSADIENWKKNLHPSLQFRGPDTPINAGSYHYVLRWVLPKQTLVMQEYSSCYTLAS